MERVLGILLGLHSNKCVGIDIIVVGSRLPEGLFTPGAWETSVAINLRVLPRCPTPIINVLLVHQTLHYTGLLPTSSHAADGCIGGFCKPGRGDRLRSYVCKQTGAAYEAPELLSPADVVSQLGKAVSDGKYRA